MFGIGSAEVVVVLLISVLLISRLWIPPLVCIPARHHHRARVRVDYVERATLVAAAILLLAVIVAAILGLATPVL